ncbi:MAG: hypothetical protein HY738_19160 [Bacteroidia bacterium]|nr:hypothetical protein [Bacteroidia bacterium]
MLKYISIAPSFRAGIGKNAFDLPLQNLEKFFKKIFPNFAEEENKDTRSILNPTLKDGAIDIFKLKFMN